MPELPELENYKVQLSNYILNVPITQIEVKRAKAVNLESEQVNRQIVGERIAFIERRGKYLNLHTNNGQRLLLSIAAGGSLFYGKTKDNADRVSDVEIQFEDHNSLYFTGARQGMFYVYTAKEAGAKLKDLGPEATDRKLTEEQFVKLYKGRRSSLKTALTNQNLVAGIGSYYADEIAFTAGLLPSAKVQELEDEALSRLYVAIQTVLEEAIQTGGHLAGQPLTVTDSLTGGFHELRRVYEREGEPSVRSAKDLIVKTEVSGKKAYYCPATQFEK